MHDADYLDILLQRMLPAFVKIPDTLCESFLLRSMVLLNSMLYVKQEISYNIQQKRFSVYISVKLVGYDLYLIL